MPDTTRPESWSLASEGFAKVTRLDYFGSPYTVWERKKSLNYGQLWSKFKDIMNQEQQEQDVAHSYQIVAAEVDLHDERQQLEADQWNEKIEQYYDNLLTNE